MKDELFPFQKIAVGNLRKLTAVALRNYRDIHVPQVISLQAPTGAGKTIIMAEFVEEVYFGSGQSNVQFAEQPEAIFVWLSDSPALNEQSKQKFQLRADRLQFGQCITIEEKSFDMEMLEDGNIYFLNTQKLGKSGNLSKHGNRRQYTIWETLENTAREKSDHLYFIIDEAHRGMQGKDAGTATSIMQRFLKGSPGLRLSPMPVVIGVSATADRFNQLVGNTTSGLNKCIITANEVRSSGLLKDRILITYPTDPKKNNDMAVLQAATEEWMKKCVHWNQYCYEQHYAQVNPVFVIQVLAGHGKALSDTNLEDVIAKVEEKLGSRFKEHEVVHTFGSSASLTVNGLPIHHVDPSDITADKRIRVVLFKENLSTGWDCPRAETMMSFRHAEDATYIAQLLGRMVRTPLKSHIRVDDYLNDVRLYLPYFNQATVKSVVDELQNTEGGEIPTVIDEESLENQVYVTLTVHPAKKKDDTPIPGQTVIFDMGVGSTTPITSDQPLTEDHSQIENGKQPEPVGPVRQPYPQQEPTPMVPLHPRTAADSSQEQPVQVEQMTIPGAAEFDREKIIKYINEQGLLTYMVRSTTINSYLKSLLNLAALLTRYAIFPSAADEISDEVTDMVRAYAEGLRQSGKYDDLASQVLSLKLSVRVFDVFGEILGSGSYSAITMSESDLDRQLRNADASMGGFGFQNRYGTRFYDEDDPTAFKIDCILFAADQECLEQLSRYAEKKFHALNDQYRRQVVKKSDQCKREYSDIITNGDAVSKLIFSLPESITVRKDDGGKEYRDHLYVGDDGLAVIKLNNWEAGVLEEEAKRPDFVCWLRNPSRARWALCIPYELDGETKPMYPDFLIVRRDERLDYVIDVLEPHGGQFADNLGKAKGMAQYAEDEPSIGRVQLIREVKGAGGKPKFKRLDFSKGSIRQIVLKAVSMDELDRIFDKYGVIS